MKHNKKLVILFAIALSFSAFDRRKSGRKRDSSSRTEHRQGVYFAQGRLRRIIRFLRRNLHRIRKSGAAIGSMNSLPPKADSFMAQGLKLMTGTDVTTKDLLRQTAGAAACRILARLYRQGRGALSLGNRCRTDAGSRSDASVDPEAVDGTAQYEGANTMVSITRQSRVDRKNMSLIIRSHDELDADYFSASAVWNF